MLISIFMDKRSFAITNGFLPSKDPLQHLPKIFRIWEAVAADLPKLLLSQNLRTTLEKLPAFKTAQLHTPAQLERAMLLLSFLGHAYVWGGGEIPSAIPKTLALPWYEVAKKLRRPPVLSYASYALHNWRRIDPKKPIALGNIVLLQNFLGGRDEEWFVLVHVEIEAKAATGIAAIVSAQQAVRAGNNKLLAKNLQQMSESLLAMCETLDRMPEQCDPYIYYNRVRPYIHGWKDNPALPLGLIYSGVRAYRNQPQLFRGETGAQSSIIPTFDAALSIKHQPDPLRIYLQEMRDYMPTEHREFIATVENQPGIRDYVLDHYHELPALAEFYNRCVELVTRFRTTHLHYAAQYIQKQHQTSLANPTETGTGGTPFMQYLKKHKEEAQQHLI